MKCSCASEPQQIVPFTNFILYYLSLGRSLLVSVNYVHLMERNSVLYLIPLQIKSSSPFTPLSLASKLWLSKESPSLLQLQFCSQIVKQA